MTDKDKTIKDELDNLRSVNSKEKNSGGNELLQFFVGLILLSIGLFLFSKRVIVRSGWLSWSIAGFNLTSGIIVLPLIIGVVWYFYNPKSIFAKIIMLLSAILIVVSIIMSVRFIFMSTSMFDYLLILILAAVGAGLILRVLFKKRD